MNIAICDDEKAIREQINGLIEKTGICTDLYETGDSLLAAGKKYVFEAFNVAAFHYLRKPIEEDKFHEVYLLPAVSGVLVSVLVRLLVITVTDGVPVLLYERYPVLYIIIPMTVIVLLGAIVFSFGIYQNMAALQKERAEKIILENQITQMQSSMVEMEHLHDGIRSVKHDMKNHMAVLQNLIRKR